MGREEKERDSTETRLERGNNARALGKIARFTPEVILSPLSANRHSALIRPLRHRKALERRGGEEER